MPLRYDVTGLSPFNLIIEEKFYTVYGNNVYVKEKLFFADSFQAIGYSPTFPDGELLVLNTDYSYSAPIEPYSTAVGQTICDQVTLITSGWTSLLIQYQALGTVVYYDASGAAVENFFEDERQVLAGRLRMRPVKNVPFFKDTFSVKGFNVTYPTGLTWIEGTHFNFGPAIEPYSSAYGSDIVEYIDLLVTNFDDIEMTLHALGNFLPYDAYATSVTNYIHDEAQPVTDSLMIMPLSHSAFYVNDFVVKGFNIDNPLGIELVPIIEFKYSPMYLDYTAATGKEVYSYIVLAEDKWDSVELTYRATGGSVDATLFNEILLAGAFDRLDPIEWMQFKGQQSTLDVHILSPEEPPQSLLEVLSYKLEEIRLVIEALPAAPVTSIPSYLTDQVLDIINGLNAQQVNVNNAMGLLNQFGVNGPLFRIIPDEEYTVVDTDIGFTLIFTSATGCDLTIDDGLIEGMYFRVVQHPTAANINFIGTAERYSTTIINGTTTPGEICYFTLTDVGVTPNHDKYLLDSNRLVADLLASSIIEITDATYTLLSTDNGKNLLFTNSTNNIVITINDDLPEFFKVKIIKGSSAKPISFTGDAIVVFGTEQNELLVPGSYAEIMMVKKEVTPNHDTFFMNIPSGTSFQPYKLKTVNTPTYTITDEDADSWITFTNATGTVITVNVGLRKGMRFKISITAEAGPITFAGTAQGFPESLTSSSMDGQLYIEFIKVIDSDGLLLLIDYYVVGSLSKVGSSGTSAVGGACRVRQCAISGPVNAFGVGEFLEIIAGSEVRTYATLDDYPLVLVFGDGYDSSGERNYIVTIDTQKTWGPGSITTGNNYYYFEYDPLTKAITQGRSTVPPQYSIRRPDVVPADTFWYPTDHRKCGEVFISGEWVNKYRVYVGFGFDNGTKTINTFAYQAKGIIKLDGHTVDVGANSIPFSTDNWDLDIKGYLEFVIDSNSYEAGQRIPLPPQITYYVSGVPCRGGFSYTRKSLPATRYKELNMILSENSGVADTHIMLLNQSTGVPFDFNFASPAGTVKFVIEANRTF